VEPQQRVDGNHGIELIGRWGVKLREHALEPCGQIALGEGEDKDEGEANSGGSVETMGWFSRSSSSLWSSLA